MIEPHDDLISEGLESQKDMRFCRRDKQCSMTFDDDGLVQLTQEPLKMSCHECGSYKTIDLDRDEVRWLRDHFDNLLKIQTT